MTCETCAYSYLTEPDKNFNAFYRCKRYDLGIKSGTSVGATVGTIQNTERREVITAFSTRGMNILICDQWIDEQEAAVLKKEW